MIVFIFVALFLSHCVVLLPKTQKRYFWWSAR